MVGIDKNRPNEYSAMMNTLTKIQKVMRVLSVIVRVLMVCAFVGGGLSLVAAVVCFCVKDFSLAASWQRLLVDVGDYSHVEIGLALLADAIYLLANGVMLVFAVLYFNIELKDGTPFTLVGAARVRRMGIVRIVATIVADLVGSLLTSFVDTNLLYSMETVSGIFFGVALILASLIFRHGAELQAQIPAAHVGETGEPAV